MGKSGSGKTSMRAVIFSNSPASLTTRLGATIDYEQNHVRFFGDLILNLWDCGGQDAFMKSYLTTQKTTIFKDVGVLIYVFDVDSKHLDKDLEYYRLVLGALAKESEDAAVFVLIHKMDLARNRDAAFSKKRDLIQEQKLQFEPLIFGTSIYDESLYEAWSHVVHVLIPNSVEISHHLSTFAAMCNASEVIMFERTTFLLIASSRHATPASPPSSQHITQLPPGTPMNPKRYERTSEIMKAFKYSCSRLREDFHSMEIEMHGLTAVLDELTRTTYIMIIVHDTSIETEAIKMNVRLARPKFESLQKLDAESN